MPHLHMEYTANLPELNADVALMRLNNALMASGQFAAEFDIKSRAVKVESFKVGTALGERAFCAYQAGTVERAFGGDQEAVVAKPVGGVAGLVRMAGQRRSAVVCGNSGY